MKKTLLSVLMAAFAFSFAPDAMARETTASVEKVGSIFGKKNKKPKAKKSKSGKNMKLRKGKSVKRY
ncbi:MULTISPECIES: hypothetical protein [Rufibacter]|uniref:Pentapeptide MXKDX repeat protein n=1 Tax=Rufibacter quisquiliarum TaxID=1549639 RepID=A0A839GF81_9BACT|nr:MULTISPECIES: hypothetical protein [Rufibacter]MBA9077562.1 hypothetical protein [Rufibacter quisquiliarum]